MRVKEVRFEKLFSIGDFNNERIGFTVELAEDDDEKKVLGELYFRVVQIEECLQALRDIEREVRSLEYEREDCELRVKASRSCVEALEEKLRLIMESSDERLKGFYESELKKHESELMELKTREDELRRINARLEELKRAREELKGRIRDGEFTLKGIPVKPSREVS